MFKEIIGHINKDNIESFYSYLLKLHKDKPEEKRLDFSSIPWIFLSSNSTFVLASTVYWPESITKLTSSKYDSVKSVIETISHYQLPHFTTLQIKAPFSLGGKDVKISEITPKENAFEVLQLNDFLDWAETNGEKEFLNHFTISKLNNKYTLAKSNGTLLYYTTDNNLNRFIEASTLKTRLCLLPQEIYVQDRGKIGLIEGAALLKYLIENGLTNTSIAKHIQNANNSSLSLQFLDLLGELKIDSTKLYTAEDAEFKILKLIAQYLVEDDAKLNAFKKKISLDNHQLSEKAFSDDIRFYKQGAATIEIKTKLKEVLPALSKSDIFNK